jgi:hypothetical protein
LLVAVLCCAALCLCVCAGEVVLVSGIVSTIDPISQVAMRLNTGDQGSMSARLHYPSGVEKVVDDVHYEVVGYVGVLEFTAVIPPSGVCVCV